MCDPEHCTAFLEDTADIVVVGSCFVNLLHYIPHFTNEKSIEGSVFEQYFSGKGANQCIAASKLGASTALIAKLGNDNFGASYLSELDEFCINTKYVWLLENVSTGIKSDFTLKEKDASVQTITIPGANAHLVPSDIEAARNMLLQAKVIVFQGETPWSTTLYCLNKLLVSPDSRARIILNVSPAVSTLDPLLLVLADVVVINEIEAGVLTNTIIQTEEDLESCAEQILDMKCNVLIITLGSSGVVYATKDSKRLKTIEVVKVENIVDKRGAGDCFVGALAYFFCYFPTLPLGEIIARSCQVSRLSLLKNGIQNSFPKKENIDSRLFSSTCEEI